MKLPPNLKNLFSPKIPASTSDKSTRLLLSPLFVVVVVSKNLRFCGSQNQAGISPAFNILCCSNNDRSHLTLYKNVHSLS